LSNPVDGATVSGVVSVKASATDNAGSAGISQTLFIDGKQVASAAGGALSFNWNTKKVASGFHTVRVVARDVAGNSSAQQVTVKR
jgi:hypothetical protein